MGLSNFPSPADGVIPLLVMNTVMSVALVKSKLRSVLEAVGGGGGSSDHELEDDVGIGGGDDSGGSRERRVSITRYGSLCKNRCSRCDGHGGCATAGGGEDWGPATGECCCVCLSRFKAEEEVSELSCKHYFHKGCLEKWFHNQHNQHITCPLCRSVM